MTRQRQSVLILYLENGALDSGVVAWSTYDGSGREAHTTGDSDTPPYARGVDALKDGWRLFQMAQLLPPHPGDEYATSFFKHECLFERWETIDD